MTQFELKYNIYIIKDGWSDNPIEANINQELSSPWNATAKMTTDSTLNLGVGNTIKIRIDQDSNQHTVFTGIIEKKNVVYPEQLGCPYVDWDFKCRSGVIMQNSYVQKEIASGQATFQIDKIVEDLIPGTIAKFSYNPAHTSSVLPAISGRIDNYWDLVKDVCDKVDWDFYIDEGSTLHAFPRGSSTSPLVVTSSDYVLKMELEEDATNILNYQEVIGGEYKNTILPINTLAWSSNGDISTLTSDNRLCVKGSILTGELCLRYSFSPNQNLLRSSAFHLGVKYNSSIDSKGPLTIKYYLYAPDSSNYFYKPVSYSGGKRLTHGQYSEVGFDRLIVDGYYFEPWQDFKVEMWIDPEWSELGNPKWSNISSLEVRVISPVGNNSELYLSAMTITSFVSGIYQSATSQATFGVRKGKPIFDTNYTSEEMCTIAASLIVEPFKSPLLSAGEVPTAYNFDYNLGEKATLNLLDNINVYEVRKIRHEFSDNRLKTYLGLETKQRLTIEDILDFYKKSLAIVNWDLETWKHKTAETGLIDTRSGLIDWSQMHEMFPYYEWIDMKNVIGVGEGLDGYTCRTGDTAGGYCSISAGGRYDLKFGGDDLHGYLASIQKTVPWWKDLMLKFELKYPATIVDAIPMWLEIGVNTWDNGDASAQFLFKGGTLYFLAGTFSLYEYIATTLNLGVYSPGEIHRLEWRYLHSIPIFYIFIDEVYKGSLLPTYWNTITSARPICCYSQTDDTTLEVYSYKLAQPWG